MLKLLKISILAIASTLGAGAHAEASDPPPAPFVCPTSEVVNDYVCTERSLMELALEVERHYLATAVVSIDDALRLRMKWQAEFLECGSLIGKEGYDSTGLNAHSCIERSLLKFGGSLEVLVDPKADSREEIYRAAWSVNAASTLLARNEHILCIQREASAIDDGVSSARDIAVVVAKRCRPQASQEAKFRAYAVELSIPFMRRGGRPTIEDRTALTAAMSEPDRLIEPILELRAARRKAAPKPPSKPTQKAKPALEL